MSQLGSMPEVMVNRVGLPPSLSRPSAHMSCVNEVCSRVPPSVLPTRSVRSPGVLRKPESQPMSRLNVGVAQ